jgi:hypothetical protein
MGCRSMSLLKDLLGCSWIELLPSEPLKLQIIFGKNK